MTDLITVEDGSRESAESWKTVHEEAMTSTSAGLGETGPQQRGQDPTGPKLWEPSHRSGGNFDLGGYQMSKLREKMETDHVSRLINYPV